MYSFNDEGMSQRSVILVTVATNQVEHGYIN